MACSRWSSPATSAAKRPTLSAGTSRRACRGLRSGSSCCGTSTAARSRPTWAWAIGPSDRLGGVPVDPAPADAPPVSEAPSLVALISQGVLDAELGALVWLLVEGRIPLVVAAPQGRAGAG